MYINLGGNTFMICGSLGPTPGVLFFMIAKNGLKWAECIVWKKQKVSGFILISFWALE